MHHLWPGHKLYPIFRTGDNHQSHNNGLLLAIKTSPDNAFLLASDIKFGHMYHSFKRIAAATLHSLLYLPLEFPAVFLSHVVFFYKFHGWHSFLFGAYLESYVKGVQDWKLNLVEHCSSSCTFIIFTTSATARVRWVSGAIIGVSALATFVSILPLDVCNVLQALIVIDESLIEFYGLNFHELISLFHAYKGRKYSQN